MTDPNPAPDANPLSENDIEVLSLALQSENAAVYSYGLITAYGNAGRREQVAVHAEAHRSRRDATASMLVAGGAEVPSAAAGYTVPFPVTDPASAAQLAVAAEEDSATAWRSALERADTEPVRSLAIDNLTDSAIRAGNWRITLGAQPPTTAFPGQPA